MRTASPTVDATRAARWRENATRLRRLLDEHPDHDWAWLWRIRLRVANYLIQRYAQVEPSVERLTAQETDPIPEPSPTPPINYTTASRDTGAASRYAWFDLAHLQTHLGNITRANLSRREQIDTEWQQTLQDLKQRLAYLKRLESKRKRIQANLKENHA